MKRDQLLLLPQVTEVSESKYCESFDLLALFLITPSYTFPMATAPAPFLSSSFPLPFLLLSLSLELLWYYILMAGRGVFMFAYIPL